MEVKIAGVSLYYIINWFFIYSFLGWLWESCYVSAKAKKIINRGFINGPLCTIYGFGAISVYLILKDFDENILILYFGGVIVATVLEYITGWLMEAIFHTRWWDYSKKPFNLQGYICLGSSIAWGAFTVLLFYVFQPFVEWITGLYPVSVGKVGISIVSVLYAVDFGSSAVTAFNLSKAFGKVEDMLEDLSSYLHTTKLYETKEEVREKLDELRVINASELAERIAEKKAEFSSQLEKKQLQLPETYEGMRAELEKRMDEFKEKYITIRKETNPVRKRMIQAYPGLKTEFRHHLERKSGKRHEKRISK